MQAPGTWIWVEETEDFMFVPNEETESHAPPTVVNVEKKEVSSSPSGDKEKRPHSLCSWGERLEKYLRRVVKR
jgi:hypothetical protein